MKVVNVSQMRGLEQAAIEDCGVPSLLLMENAAAGFLMALERETGSVAGKKIHVFCGRGNNGGDGFAIARMAHNLHADVTITLLFDETLAEGDAKTNLKIVKKMGIPFSAAGGGISCDIIVDAIFGTGFHGEIEGNVKSCIDAINNSGAFVASVDIPSGVSADTGHASASSVFADLCVTFAALKPGHLLFPGRGHFLKLIKGNISVPREVINELRSGYDVIDNSKRELIPKRETNSHKGSFGKALAFVGSAGMSGAAVLSSSAILKSGAGMATAAVPETVLGAVCAHLTSVMTVPLPCENGSLAEPAADLLLEKLKHQDVLLAGCGIGTSDAAKKTICRLVTENEKPMVLDADGLNAVSGCTELLLEKKCELILTPHIVEFSRLTGLTVLKIKENPILAAREFAQKFQVTLVLKDAVTVVAAKDGTVFISPSSNSGLATAGSGDVLAGIITGLLSQGARPEHAAVGGVYLHLAAGNIARKAKGEYGMTSEDLLSSVPAAFMEEIDIAPDIKEW